MQDAHIPQTEISNGLINARIYLPDAVKGYYRGTRFDWSGVISVLESGGHNYFGKWFKSYSPTLHDAIMGPVDDFTPVGYNDAKPGEIFLKIGIGIITKPDDTPYDFHRTYPIVNGGKWKVMIRKDMVQFNHDLKYEDYYYEYEKTVKLLKDKPEMIISHTFRNKGSRAIETPVYNHNFFMLDNQPVGPGYTARFPFTLSGVFVDGPDIAGIKGNSVVLGREIGEGETIFSTGLKGFGQSANDYDIRIENLSAGAGVRITCDRPLLKLVFWACPTTFCPEPYIVLSAESGQEFSWDIRYEFYRL
jgi:hypothetical protein